MAIVITDANQLNVTVYILGKNIAGMGRAERCLNALKPADVLPQTINKQVGRTFNDDLFDPHESIGRGPSGSDRPPFGVGVLTMSS